MLIYDIVMSFHIWRKIYYVFGWEYPEKADERQKHLKHCLCNQIKNTKDIQKILKEQGEIKETDFEHNINELSTFEHSINHYTNALTKPYKDLLIDIPTPRAYTHIDTPIPNEDAMNKYIVDKDGIIIDTPSGYTRLNNNNNNKRKSRTKKRKRNKF
jgi:hypothetical protein